MIGRRPGELLQSKFQNGKVLLSLFAKLYTRIHGEPNQQWLRPERALVTGCNARHQERRRPRESENPSRKSNRDGKAIAEFASFESTTKRGVSVFQWGQRQFQREQLSQPLFSEHGPQWQDFAGIRDFLLPQQMPEPSRTRCLMERMSQRIDSRILKPVNGLLDRFQQIKGE